MSNLWICGASSQKTRAHTTLGIFLLRKQLDHAKELCQVSFLYFPSYTVFIHQCLWHITYPANNVSFLRRQEKGKKHFPFALFQDSCSQEGLAQEGLVQNGSAMGLTSFCKNTVLILELLSVAEIPLTNRIHFTWLTSNPFTDIKLLILQDIQCLHFPLKWNTVLQQNHLQCHDLPFTLGVNSVTN